MEHHPPPVGRQAIVVEVRVRALEKPAGCLGLEVDDGYRHVWLQRAEDQEPPTVRRPVPDPRIALLAYPFWRPPGRRDAVDRFRPPVAVKDLRSISTNVR